MREVCAALSVRSTAGEPRLAASGSTPARTSAQRGASRPPRRVRRWWSRLGRMARPVLGRVGPEVPAGGGGVWTRLGPATTGGGARSPPCVGRGHDAVAGDPRRWRRPPAGRGAGAAPPPPALDSAATAPPPPGRRHRPPPPLPRLPPPSRLAGAPSGLTEAPVSRGARRYRATLGAAVAGPGATVHCRSSPSPPPAAVDAVTTAAATTGRRRPRCRRTLGHAAAHHRQTALGSTAGYRR